MKAAVRSGQSASVEEKPKDARTRYFVLLRAALMCEGARGWGAHRRRFWRRPPVHGATRTTRARIRPRAEQRGGTRRARSSRGHPRMSRVPPVGPLPGGPWTTVRGARDGASRRACRRPRTLMTRDILGKSLTASFRACIACVAPRSMAFREACARDVTGTRPDFRMLILFRAHLNVGFKLCGFQSEGSVKRFSLTHFACRCLSIHLSKYNANIHCTFRS